MFDKIEIVIDTNLSVDVTPSDIFTVLKDSLSDFRVIRQYVTDYVNKKAERGHIKEEDIDETIQRVIGRIELCRDLEVGLCPSPGFITITRDIETEDCSNKRKKKSVQRHIDDLERWKDNRLRKHLDVRALRTSTQMLREYMELLNE